MDGAGMTKGALGLFYQAELTIIERDIVFYITGFGPMYTRD